MVGYIIVILTKSSESGCLQPQHTLGGLLAAPVGLTPDLQDKLQIVVKAVAV